MTERQNDDSGYPESSFEGCDDDSGYQKSSLELGDDDSGYQESSLELGDDVFLVCSIIFNLCGC